MRAADKRLLWEVLAEAAVEAAAVEAQFTPRTAAAAAAAAVNAVLEVEPGVSVLIL